IVRSQNDVADGGDEGDEGMSFVYSGNLNVKVIQYSDVTAWKARLAEHPISVVYELATPFWEEFDDATQALITSLETYYPVTRLMVSGDPLCRMVYARDPQTYIENKLAEISAAIMNN
ncbi:MAG: hypothetical protein Q4C58_16075, partial [Eubacteriales bacterium]|nr:hypothetical protein [Eubacteriales bacterium]